MRKIILLFAAIVLSRSSYSQQNQIDSFKRVLETAKEDTSKVNALNKVTSLCLQTPPDYKKALLFAEKSKLLAEKLSYKKGIAIAHHYLGIIYDYFGLYEKAFQNYLDGLKIWETLKDSGMIIQSYQNLSSAYSLQKQYKKALEIDWKLEKLAEANHDKQKIVFALWALAGDYSNICKKAIADGNSALANYNYEKSIELELRALKISTDIKDSSSIAVLYYSVGNIYDKCNLCEENKLITETNLIKPDYYNKAEESYFKSLEIYQQLNDEGGVSTCYLNLGFFYRNQGNLCAAKNKLPEADINYQKSLAYYLKAFAIIKKLGYKHGVAYYSKEVGKAYLKLGKLKDAESYLLHAATGFEEIGYKEGAKESYELLSEVTLKEKDYNKALEYYKDFSRLKDSLLNEESVKQLTETEIKFETEKKDNEILLLNKDKQIEQSKIEQQSRNVFLIALVAALLIVSILIYVKFERNKTSLQLKELQQRALRAQLNPHFIFNVMQSIKNEYALNAEKGEELLVNFSALIREVLDKSFLSEGTLQDEIDLVNKYITVESQHTAFNLRFTLQMDDSINASQVAFPSLALQPIIENAVRYGAACNDIVLTIKRKDNLLIIAVENDLPGDSHLNSNTARSSTGLHLTEQRINLFNKKYKLKGSIESIKKDAKFITTISLAFIINQPEV